MSEPKDVAAITDRVEAHMRANLYRIEQAWPYTVPVGLPGRAELEKHAIAVHNNNNDIKKWAGQRGCETTVTQRKIGTAVGLVSAVTVPDEATALRVVGDGLATQYREARRRLDRLRAEFDAEPDTIEAVAAMTGHEQALDFDLLITAAHYFADHDAAGMRPRQVPLTGFSGKWLNESNTRRRKAICRLLGRETLELSSRPRELRFRYLDPRRADAELERIAWCPWTGTALAGIRYAVIVENKDTYQDMPPIPDGICIWGSGNAIGAVAPEIPALRDMRVVYWGDMDADGLEILSMLRERGLDCDSMFMDCAAYERYRRYGTNLSERGRRLALRDPKPAPGLRPAERELYVRLCEDAAMPFRRVEQERITLADAAEALRGLGVPAGRA